jgi:hypothetical protein
MENAAARIQRAFRRHMEKIRVTPLKHSDYYQFANKKGSICFRLLCNEPYYVDLMQPENIENIEYHESIVIIRHDARRCIIVDLSNGVVYYRIDDFTCKMYSGSVRMVKSDETEMPAIPPRKHIQNLSTFNGDFDGDEMNVVSRPSPKWSACKS